MKHAYDEACEELFFFPKIEQHNRVNNMYIHQYQYIAFSEAQKAYLTDLF